MRLRCKSMPMYKWYLLLGFICGSTQLHAQDILHVTPGTDLHIAAGTSFYAGGLLLQPSSSFVVNGNSLQRSGSVSQFTVYNYASRVYTFSQLMPAFAGSIRFYYDDAELNSLTEGQLSVNVYNGTYWQALTAGSYDMTNNYVEPAAVSGLTMRELALSDALHILPLQWGPVLAWRSNTTVMVQWTTRQESQVRDFIVERSTDARNWTATGSAIAAHNNGAENRYELADVNAPAGKLLYRIRQTDVDGRFTLSPIVQVAAGNLPAVAVFPNPARERFSLQGVDATDILKIELYTVYGARVQQWNQAQSYYSLSGLSQGLYQLRIELRNGQHYQFKLTKY